MPSTQRLRRVFIAAAALLAVSAVGASVVLGMPNRSAPAPDVGTLQEAVAVALDPVAGSTVRGTARLAVETGGRVLLTVDAEGLVPDGSYPVHIHAGTPAQPSASFGLTGTLQANGSGRASLTTGTMSASAAGAAVDLSLDQLTDGGHFIEIHGTGGEVAARGVILSSGEAPTAEQPAGPTGIPAADAVIDAVRADDVDRLVSLTHLAQMQCGPLTPEGFALVPECRAGEAPGTAVRVLPAAACEPYWVRDPRPTLRDALEQAGDLYAVVEHPKSGYLIIYAPRPNSHVFAVAFYVGSEGIVRVEAGCRGPADLASDGGRPLPVVLPPAGKIEAPQPKPVTTGIAGVDAAVEAAVNRDIKSLLRLVRYTEVECWSGRPGMGAPSSCDTLGLRPGTMLETLPVSTCELEFTPKPGVPERLASLLNHSSIRLAGVFEPAVTQITAMVGKMDYGVVLKMGAEKGYTALFMQGGQVVMAATGCGAVMPPDSLVARWIVTPPAEQRVGGTS